MKIVLVSKTKIGSFYISFHQMFELAVFFIVLYGQLCNNFIELPSSALKIHEHTTNKK